MIDALKFIQGAVAKREPIPMLTHICIKDGFIKAFNGRYALCSPINLDITATPKAIPFINAIKNCKDTVAFHMAANGKLGIKSGKFKVYIDCLNDPYPELLPHGPGYRLDLTFGLLPALELLEPFISDDNHHIWARGVLLRGSAAYATDNTAILEAWLGSSFPIDACVPGDTVAELLRIGEEPIGIQVAENALTFHYTGDRWLMTQLFDAKWPDVTKHFNTADLALCHEVPKDFFKSIASLLPFCDEQHRVYMCQDKIITHPDESNGATVEMPGIYPAGVFSAKRLTMLKDVLHKACFRDGRPSPFYNAEKNIRGVFIGMGSRT